MATVATRAGLREQLGQPRVSGSGTAPGLAHQPVGAVVLMWLPEAALGKYRVRGTNR